MCGAWGGVGIGGFSSGGLCWGRGNSGDILGECQTRDILGTEIQFCVRVGTEILAHQVRRPLQVKLTQRLLTGAAHMCTELSTGEDLNALPTNFAEWCIDGAEKMDDSIGASSLYEGEEVEQLTVSRGLVLVVPVVGEGAMAVDVGT